jgi:ribosomal protein S27AE
MAHPFAGRKGSTFARRVKQEQFVSLIGKCPMCGQPLAPDVFSNPLDHVKPYKLRPDLTFDRENLRIVCGRCHNGTCAAIEAKHAGDAEAIAKAKLSYRPVGLDGYPVRVGGMPNL